MDLWHTLIQKAKTADTVWWIFFATPKRSDTVCPIRVTPSSLVSLRATYTSRRQKGSWMVCKGGIRARLEFQNLEPQYQHLILWTSSYILVDLKVNRITYQDVGQMDMYLQMYDKMKKVRRCLTFFNLIFRITIHFYAKLSLFLA